MSFNLLCLLVSLVWLPFSTWLISHFPLFEYNSYGFFAAIFFIFLPLIFLTVYGVYYEWSGEVEEKAELRQQLSKVQIRLDRVNYSLTSNSRSVILARLLVGDLKSISRIAGMGVKLEIIVENIFESLSRNLGVTKVSLWLLSKKTGEQTLTYNFGWSEEELASLVSNEELESYGKEESLTFPLIVHQKRLGTLRIDAASDKKLLSTGEEKDLIEVLTYLLAVHIELSLVQAGRIIAEDDDDGVGVYSYHHMMRLLGRESSRAVRYGEIYTILLVEISRFSSLFELHGAQECEALCDSLALLLSSLVREMDVVGRYGNGAFLVMLPQTHKVGGVNLARRIEKYSEKGLSMGNSGLLVDVVVSVATFPEDGNDELKLISNVSDDWRYSDRPEEQ
jgi:diguanylate cyclase (GGDEF)-like protein